MPTDFAAAAAAAAAKLSTSLLTVVEHLHCSLQQQVVVTVLVVLQHKLQQHVKHCIRNTPHSTHRRASSACFGDI
jgi:hypothetical protein